MKKPQITPAALSALLRGDRENFIAASTPGGIEAQEAAGQMEQSLLQTLPRDNRDRESFEKLGFKFGKDIDDIFVEVEFPKGWRKKPTDHSMWTKILDEKGRERGSIFYKAAFYDRSAHVSLSRRFGVRQSYGEDGKETESVYIEDANHEVKKRIEGFLKPDWNDREEAKKRSYKIDAATKELTDWLASEYPNWNDVLAYWD